VDNASRRPWCPCNGVRFTLSKILGAKKAEVLVNELSAQISVDQSGFSENVGLAFITPQKKLVVPVVLLGAFDELICKDAGINYQRVGTGMQTKGKSDLSDRLLYEGARQKVRDQMYWKGADINRYWIASSTERYCRPNYNEFIRTSEVVRLMRISANVTAHFGPS